MGHGLLARDGARGDRRRHDLRRLRVADDRALRRKGAALAPRHRPGSSLPRRPRAPRRQRRREARRGPAPPHRAPAPPRAHAARHRGRDRSGPKRLGAPVGRRGIRGASRGDRQHRHHDRRAQGQPRPRPRHRRGGRAAAHRGECRGLPGRGGAAAGAARWSRDRGVAALRAHGHRSRPRDLPAAPGQRRGGDRPEAGAQHAHRRVRCPPLPRSRRAHRRLWTHAVQESPARRSR